MKKNKALILNFMEEEEQEAQGKPAPPDNFINSEFTQLLDGYINFYKESIRIDQHGFMIDGEFFPFANKNELKIEKVLGRGSAAKVQLVSLNNNPAVKYALKTFNAYEKTNRLQLLNDVKNYVKSKNECPFIIHFFGAFYEAGNVSILLEFMPRGSLKDLIDDFRSSERIMPEWLIKSIAEQILNGLAFIHNISHQIHLDLKPENVLLRGRDYQELEVKISDFGVSKGLQSTNDNAVSFVGTFFYMSPERLMNKNYSTKADIWALGMIVYELILLRYPFSHCKSYIDLMQFCKQSKSVVNTRDLPDSCSPNLILFLKDSLRIEQEERPSSMQLLNHKWFIEA
jgi:serine/threonine protein kinase